MLSTPATLRSPKTVGALRVRDDAPPLPGAMGYTAHKRGDGLRWSIEPGTLTRDHWLSCDMLIEGHIQATFQLTITEEGGDDRNRFTLIFGLLNQCQGRVRLHMSALNQNAWALGREAAVLKRICFGDAVEPAHAATIELTVARTDGQPVRFWLTEPVLSETEPKLPNRPVLPKRLLCDELGQSTLSDWPGKTKSVDEMHARVKGYAAGKGLRAKPAQRTRWGGWSGKRFEATGYFRTQHDGNRWWLTDPEGYAFWSTGPDVTSPRIEARVAGIESAVPRPLIDNPAYRRGKSRSLDIMVGHLHRTFGDDWHAQWQKLVVHLLHDAGFNTFGNWSDWRTASGARFPYVRPLSFRSRRTRTVFRDFPDVFDAASFEADAAEYAEALEPSADDPALIGYFLMNEPQWGFAKQTPAEGMLINTPRCRTREALADWLKQKRDTPAALARAWGGGVTFDDVASGDWSHTLTQQARADLRAFSTAMVRKLYDTLSAACRKVDAHHLNLGARYFRPPPGWALAGMTSFDVFSINRYDQTPDAEALTAMSKATGKPVIIGEWHFGALDRGLPATGIQRVADQAERGKAYRRYIELAAAHPACVGAHWFTLYDQSCLGRFDGEAYNIGFYDVCHQPYQALVDAARASHERLYRIAVGQLEPFDEKVEYRPALFH